jgi:hypothetical protein
VFSPAGAFKWYSDSGPEGGAILLRATATYEEAIFAFDSYASNVYTKCPQLSKFAVGMTNGAVAQMAGMPRTSRLHCWLYAATREQDGRRVCFVNGRATVVQRGNHG